MASLILAPIWISIAVVLLYFHYRYRIAEVRALRKRYRQIRAQSDAPMLVCANHLTLIDSMLVAWSMGSIGYWLRNFDELPWNTPERTNFGRNWAARTVIFIVKCIPIRRGGAREDVGVVLERVKYLLQQGETALIFPEAGRSR
jgi:1-acyl-sn-glycerol-3-phosphate acyltransferase